MDAVRIKDTAGIVLGEAAPRVNAKDPLEDEVRKKQASRNLNLPMHYHLNKSLQ
jgi:hypothetical protein